MVTDNVSAAQSGKTDSTIGAFTGMSLSTENSNGIEINAASLCHTSPHFKSRAGRRIHLVFVVHFNDFAVVLREHGACNFQEL